MSQLIRTPKFQEKIKRDQIYLKEMNQDAFDESLMKNLLVQKPREVSKKSLLKIHEDFILNNLLETIFKWSTITLLTNNTDMPFVTSDSPVVYNNAEFIPSYLHKKDTVYFMMISNENTIFYFPIDPRFSIIINKFNNEKTDATIQYMELFDEEKIMTFNKLEYQYSKGFIYMREEDIELIQSIREECGTEINKDYQSMEYSYSVMKEEMEKRIEKLKA